jgi:hypothetical protein
MIVELRQYTLRPGRRDDLIDLFDRELVETQEATGMTVIGQFRDLDRPDRFVWLRGFADMPRRAEALTAFYSGPVWRAHGPAANATMIDSDDVLLLRPTTAFAVPATPRPPVGAPPPRSLVVASICYGERPFDSSYAELFDRIARPALTGAGAEVIATFQTEYAENTFPRLPVRTGEHVFVWLARFRDPAQLRVLDDVPPALTKPLIAAPEQLRLAPTGRSLLR